MISTPPQSCSGFCQGWWGPAWFPTCAVTCICARGPLCARRAPGAGGARGALDACGARGASGAQGALGTLGPLGRQAHLVRAERVARVPHLASVARLSSVLVPSGCPSNGDPWLCRDSGATYVVGGRVGVSETACGRVGSLTPPPTPSPGPGRGGSRAVRASKMAPDGSKRAAESPR